MVFIEASYWPQVTINAECQLHKIVGANREAIESREKIFSE